MWHICIWGYTLLTCSNIKSWNVLVPDTIVLVLGYYCAGYHLSWIWLTFLKTFQKLSTLCLWSELDCSYVRVSLWNCLSMVSASNFSDDWPVVDRGREFSPPKIGGKIEKMASFTFILCVWANNCIKMSHQLKKFSNFPSQNCD